MKAITYQDIKDVKVKTVNDPKIEKPDDAVIKVNRLLIGIVLTHNFIRAKGWWLIWISRSKTVQYWNVGVNSFAQKLQQPLKCGADVP